MLNKFSLVLHWCLYNKENVIAELAEHSPIIIQNSSNPSSRKKFGCTTVRLYKVLLLSCMVNCTAGTPMPRLCSVVQWSVHWTLSQTTWVLVLTRAWCCALETCRGKKKQALLLGLAKSICYGCLEIQNFPSYAEKDLTHREILYLPSHVMSSISRINRAVKRLLFSNFLLLQGLLGLIVLLLKIKFKLWCHSFMFVPL